jgi:hypothetical protein
MKSNISDPEKINAVLNALDITAHSLAQKCGYKSHASIYHVINKVNSLSEGMIDKIIKAVPNVNYNFLKKGELPVLLTGKEMEAQLNLFNIPHQETSDFIRFKRLMEIPERLDRIESMLLELFPEKFEEN